MAQYDPYEEEDGEFQELSPFFEENLVEALDNNVQFLVNKALGKVLGPLTSHLKGFVCQQGWLSLIAPSAGPFPQPSKSSKGKAKSQKWEHSVGFEQLSVTALEEYGYSNPRSQTLSSDDSLRYSELAGFDSSWDPSDSDQDEMPGPCKRRRPERGPDPGPIPLKVLTFYPTEIIHPGSTNRTPPP
ncbi:hypothetical protein NDU88_001599 [Pleurodeles waltl]|uniref:Uncharacterized protein n=1 Tax=Pleurodeles waltl TaxID=8319 RepID=A0AAV7MLD6_PLEWA|nr:hypothetical protein NDU88_001599 [Pleurodeles waltl]